MAAVISEAEAGKIEVGQPSSESFLINPDQGRVIGNTLTQRPKGTLVVADLKLQLLSRHVPPEVLAELTEVRRLVRTAIDDLSLLDFHLPRGPLPITNEFASLDDPHTMIDLDKLRAELPPSLIH